MLNINYSSLAEPQKSAYMPPLYVCFLTPFLLIKQVILRNILLLVAQAIFGCFTIWLLAQYVERQFSILVAHVAALLYAIIPEFIYSVRSYTPTIFFQIFLLLFLLVRKDYFKLDSKIYSPLQGAFIAAAIYCRSEFALFALLIFISVLLKKQIKSALLFIVTIIMFLLPWTIRNYQVFHKFIPLTTNSGFNLYRGNNTIGIGDWGTEEINSKIILLSKNSPIEIAQNEVCKNEAIRFLINNPGKVFKNAVIKIFDLWILNIDDNRSLVFLQIVISVVFDFLFLLGFIKSFNITIYKLEYGYFLYSTIIAVAFFVLPRYQTMLHILMVPFCAYGLYIILFIRNNGAKKSVGC